MSPYILTLGKIKPSSTLSLASKPKINNQITARIAKSAEQITINGLEY